MTALLQREMNRVLKEIHECGTKLYTFLGVRRSWGWGVTNSPREGRGGKGDGQMSRPVRQDFRETS